MASDLKTIEQVDEILDEVNEAFFDIPFENSAYQTEKFVIAASITPERAYRSIGLRMANRIQALQEAKFTTLNHQIDLDEMNDKIAAGELTQYDMRREDAKREKTKGDMAYSKKLINDAIVELNILYKHFKALPKFTREQFEAGERRHFMERLNRQDVLSANQQSLIHMNEDADTLTAFEGVTKDIDYINDERLESLNNQALNIRDNLTEDGQCAAPKLKVLPTGNG